MDIRELIHHLPTKPPIGLQEWAHAYDNTLGGNLLLFQRESVGVERWDKKRQKLCMVSRWGARCTCTVCGEEFVTGWCSYPKAGVKGIRIHMGEDGFWPGYVEPGEDESIEVAEGDAVPCPWCETNVTLVATSSIPSGRTWQVMLGNVTVVEEYTVVMTWLYRRRLDGEGIFSEDIRPARAVAITKRGGLRRFDHVKANQYGGTYDLPCWTEVRNTGEDPFLMFYYNYDANNHKQVGGFFWKTMPSLAGTTGEKTGLAEYVMNGGWRLVVYLKLWQEWPYVENLIKSPFGGQLVRDVDGQIDQHLDYGNRSGRVHITWADLAESRPGRMLGMTKGEMTALKTWSIAKLEEWSEYRRYSARMTAAQFNQCLELVGLEAMRIINAHGAEMFDEGWVETAVRYVARQKEMTARAAAGLLCDLWRMLEEEAEGRIVADEELWPRDLRGAHDRLADERSLRKNAKENAKLSAGFRAVVDKYSVLEWTDGELCVRLPRQNSELKMEGATLRHCVGGYGAGHVAERTVVFFVRHYRRPERSYYTMDYDMTAKPYRRQLHGYGNEHHGEHKQYRHTIPKKVTAFVERWEREVLWPWYAKQITKVAENKKQKSA